MGLDALCRVVPEVELQGEVSGRLLIVQPFVKNLVQFVVADPLLNHSLTVVGAPLLEAVVERKRLLVDGVNVLPEEHPLVV